MVKQIKDKEDNVVAELLQEDDIQTEVEGTVAVIGYASQGAAQSKCFRDTGITTILGLRRSGESWKRAEEDGWVERQTLFEIQDAVKKADIICMLFADTAQSQVYKEKIAPYLSAGKTLYFSHGFNIHYGNIVPQDNVDVVMLAPKGPGTVVREMYKAGFGVPALVAVEQDSSGRAWNTVLGLAKALGAAKPGVLKTTFKDEVESDLFGEQADLLGGVSELVKNAFEVLVEAGYNPLLAYFEVHHELYGLLAPLAYKFGNAGMIRACSLTARDGAMQSGKEVIDEHVKENMQAVLRRIQTGEYAKGWIERYNEKGVAAVEEPLEELDSHLLEVVGKQIRKAMWPDQGKW